MLQQEQDCIALDLYAEQAYLSYAMSVVKGRAIPHVADGCKPVQRRILYAMHDLGLTPQAKPVKSARVVGELLGKYHPHGDSAAYEAMVRMAQDFSLRYPLIDGQGNFGSPDDPSAAMRYTEARLSKFADLLLDEIDVGTVDFVDNYDGAYQEPSLLPSRLPMLLLNGSSGIAVGMACEIPSHNVVDVANATVALIDDPKLANPELATILQGPDFPGGGQIISSLDEIQHAYCTGRGSVRVRAVFHFEELARHQWQLVIDQLPPGVSTAKILFEIEECLSPKIKQGKKTLTPEQAKTKIHFNALLEKVKDDSDSSNPIRLIFIPKTSKIDRDELLALLIQHTSMEVNVSFNLVTIGNDGRPRQMNLKEILVDWLDKRRETIYRRTYFRIDKILKQLHILEGRKIAFLNLDKVIKIIRESDDPKQELLAKLPLSEIQVEDILEIRLRQLSRLEGVAIDKKIADLLKEQADLAKILGKNTSGIFDLKQTTKALDKLMRSEIVWDATKYADPRRTLIKPEARVQATKVIKDEEVVLSVTKRGWIRAGNIALKNGDELLAQLSTRTTWPMVVLDSTGRSYSVLVDDLMGLKQEGVPISTLFQLSGSIVSVLSDHPDSVYLLCSKTGYGFYAKLNDLVTRQKAGKAVMTIYTEQGDSPLPPVRYKEGLVALYTTDGKLLAYENNSIPTLSSGRGLQLMARKNSETFVETVGIYSKPRCKLEYLSKRAVKINGGATDATMRNRITTSMDLADYLGARAGKGKPTNSLYQEPRFLPE